jgi:hypothetical protein
MRAYSAVSNNRDASEDTRRYFISRARGLLIVFLILGVFIGPQMLEPKDVVECEPVTVMSYHQGSVVSALRSPLMVLIRCGRSRRDKSSGPNVSGFSYATVSIGESGRV